MKVFILLLALLYLSVAHAQVNIDIEAPYFDAPDTLEVRIWNDYMGFPYNNEYQLYRAANKDGRYSFSFEPDGQRVWMTLHLHYQRIKGDPSIGIMRGFLLENKDSLQISVAPKNTPFLKAQKFYDNGLIVSDDDAWGVRVTGRGRDKLQAKLLLDSCIEKELRVDRSDLGSDSAYMQMLYRKFRSAIEGSGLHMDSEIRELLVFNAMGHLLDELVRCASSNYYTMPIDSPLTVMDAFPELWFDERWFDKQQLDHIVKSPDFVEYLLNFYMLASYGEHRRHSFGDVYSTIKKRVFHPVLRGRVLSRFMIDYFYGNSDVSYLEESLALAKDDLSLVWLRRLLRGIKGKHIDFELSDINERVYRTGDFKGKVVLVDFWYTACIPCRHYMAEVLTPVADYFKDNPHVQVVTVNLDSHALFKKSLFGDNRFLPSTGLHLYTQGKRFQHPVIQDLAIQSYPHTILLDQEGKIVATKNELKRKEDVVEVIDRLIDRQ